MSMKETQPVPDGIKKPEAPPAPPPPFGKSGVKIVTPGNGKGPFTSIGTKVIDLETGNEIKNIREIHVHILRDDVVRAELVMFPSAVAIEGAKARVLVEDRVSRSAVVAFLKNHIHKFIKLEDSYREAASSLDLPGLLKRFDLIFPEGLTETTTLADRWKRFKRINRGRRSLLCRLWHLTKGDSHKC